MALLAEGIEALTILWIVIAFAFGAGLVWLIDRAYLRSVGRTREKIIEEGKKEAEAFRKESELQVKSDLVKIREKAEEEIQAQRRDLLSNEKNLTKKEDGLNRKL